MLRVGHSRATIYLTPSHGSEASAGTVDIFAPGELSGLLASADERMIAFLAIKRAEQKAKKKPSFAEVARPEAGHLERLLMGEMQWEMQKMFPQYLEAAELLVPGDWIPQRSAP